MSDNFEFDSPEFKAWLDKWIPGDAPAEGEVGAIVWGVAIEPHAEPQELQQPHSLSGHSFAEPGNFSATVGWLPPAYPTARAIDVPVHNHHYTSATVPRIHSEDQSTSVTELPHAKPVATPFSPFDHALETGALAATIDIDTGCQITSSTDSDTPAASVPALSNEYGDPPIVFSYEINDGTYPGILSRSNLLSPVVPLPTSSGSLSTMTAMEGSAGSLPVAETTTLTSPTSTCSIPARGIGVSDDRKSSESFSCTQQGCRSRTIFKRKYELKRHIKSVHEKATKFPCPVISCYKKGTESLTRPDKFREHLRVSHVYDDLSECPDSSCSVVLPLLLLQQHVKNHAILEVPRMEAIGGYMEVNDRVRGCPIEGCRKSLPAQELHLHLGTAHTEEQRQTNRVAIAASGFDHVRCTIICPVCKIQSPSFDEAREHVLQLHIYFDYDHHKAMRNVVQQVLDDATKCKHECGYTIVPAFYMNSIHRVRSSWDYNAQLETARCPQCSAVIFKGEAYAEKTVSHELDLLQRTDALFEHRLGLLKLFSSFERHPVFAPDWPMDHELRKETIEKHFSKEWISDHYGLVYGPATGIGSRSMEQT